MYGWATKSASVKTSKQKKQHSPTRYQVGQHSKQEEAAKHRAENMTNVLAESNYFYRVINIRYKFSCMPDTVCMHITYTVATVHAICENLC